MTELPKVLVDLILDYKYGLEHVLKFRVCLLELSFYNMAHRPRWLAFHSIGYWLPF